MKTNNNGNNANNSNETRNAAAMVASNNNQNERKPLRKVLTAATTYDGKPARIKCVITDERGYISITGELTPYRCRTPHVSGCIHEEISKAFPKLRPFLWLHLANLDGSIMHEVANSLYFIANDDEEAAQRALHCTDEEIRELSALVHYGLSRSRCWYKYNDERTAYEVKSEDSRKIYADHLAALGLQERRREAIRDFYGTLESMK